MSMAGCSSSVRKGLVGSAEGCSSAMRAGPVSLEGKGDSLGFRSGVLLFREGRLGFLRGQVWVRGGDSLGLSGGVLLSQEERLGFHEGQACVCNVILLGSRVLCSSAGREGLVSAEAKFVSVR